MISHTPSQIISSDTTKETLLRLGKPFIEFPRFSIRDVSSERDHEGKSVPFSAWLTRQLKLGKPFVISDFDQVQSWSNPPASGLHDGSIPGFDIERLIELSTKKNIPIRNCSTGRDLSFTLRKFTESARESIPEFQNLYARDLQCPTEWLERCRDVLPAELQWGGRLDLFQWLPACARSEVMMAYVGSEGSSSGFHRCFSSTLALNFLVASENARPVVCIGTDFDSQQKYDAFMSSRGVSPHLDWHNLSSSDLQQTDFPLYVCDQRVGDLVVFPPATAHQIWNPSALSTKLVWNILHPLSLEVSTHHVQSSLNRLCHPDVACTNLALASAMLSLMPDDDCLRSENSLPPPPDLPLLSRLFRSVVHDETIKSEIPATPISLVTLGEGVLATCNFCSTAIWNRHVRCTVCTDFDLCLLCFINGRSCEHCQSYVWAELILPDRCSRVLNRAQEILGFQWKEAPLSNTCKTLGTAVDDLIKSKTSTATKLCHLCRIDHTEWKGRRCDKCTAFFCYRGLYRHFDMQPADVIRHDGRWVCPKCQELCNCRCCHFATAYLRSEKPASKRRVKARDPRGKVMGFADNVFDQKRGANKETGKIILPSPQISGKKRSFETIDSYEDHTSMIPSQKVELPTPDPDYSGSRSFFSRDLPEGFGGSYRNNNMPLMPYGVKIFTEQRAGLTSPVEERHGLSLFTTQRSIPPHNFTDSNILPPMLSRSASMSPNGQAAGANDNNSLKTGHKAASYLDTVTTTQTYSITQPYQTVSQIQSNQVAERTPISNSHPTPGNSGPPSHSGRSTEGNILDESIMRLELEIQNLHKYEEEFISLKLEDSLKMLRRQMSQLEWDLDNRKRERGMGLVDRLRRQGFTSLAEVVGLEVGITTAGDRYEDTD